MSTRKSPAGKAARRAVHRAAQPQARSRNDLELDAADAFRRLSALGALLEATSDADTPIESDEFWPIATSIMVEVPDTWPGDGAGGPPHAVEIGDMIRQETKRAKTAFDELCELSNAANRAGAQS
jgi:hypothetical protein